MSTATRAFALAILAASASKAQAPDWVVPDAAPATLTRWYGYQTLLADAGALTLGAIALSKSHDPHAGSAGSSSMVFG